MDDLSELQKNEEFDLHERQLELIHKILKDIIMKRIFQKTTIESKLIYHGRDRILQTL